MSPTTGGMHWRRLLAEAGLPEAPPEPDPLVTAIVEDSRQAGPGACFVACRGVQADGHDFIAAAVAAGACAVVSERPVSLPESVARLVVERGRGVAARLAAALTGVSQAQRAGRLAAVGITGTNGKSTFCYLLRSILRLDGQAPAMFGTIEYDLLCRRIDASMTTPPATALMGYIAEAAAAGASHVVMEVSSHALDQGRCEGLRFDVGVFSNLTGDHLDYHGDMESYLRAKKRLFDGLDERAKAVVNLEDPSWEPLVADCRAQLLGYAIEGGRASRRPDVAARLIEATAQGTRFELIAGPAATGGGEVHAEVRSALIGRHNVQNCLAAAGAALACGVSPDRVAAGLEAVRRVPGRLEAVRPDGGDPGFSVLVDYAHTDDALENVLSAVRPLTQGRLIVLFGCGGDRDRTKRPRMARVAARWADEIVLTSDNPRTEDPQRILEDILEGFNGARRERVRVEPDRRAAIAAALQAAGPGDVVVLAGKGHENYQIIGSRKLPFDDAAVAAEILATRCGAGLSSTPAGRSGAGR